MTALEYFLKAFNEIPNTLDYDPQWRGIRSKEFDYAVFSRHCAKLHNGQIATAESDLGQKMILIGTRFGNVVIFERYSPGTGVLPALGINHTKHFRKGGWVRGSDPTLPELEVLLGNEEEPSNIGVRIEQLYAFMRGRR